MKRILSILFLFVFLFNLAGYFIVFEVRQYSAKQEMKIFIKNNIPENELTKIIIPNSELTSSSSEFRQTEENEFVYQGKYYDIVNKKTDGNNTIFYCINDKNEEKLFEELAEVCENSFFFSR